MRDERLENMKKDYDEIQIPDTLLQRVESGIKMAKKEKEEEKRMNRKSRMITFAKAAGGAVAAAMVAITVMTNSGANIANAMAKIPVIGAIAEVVTFREYKNEENHMTADVKTPEISVKDESGTVNEESTEKINKSIQEYTDEIIAQYEADVKASGGEGYMDVNLDYQVITDSDRLFSIRFDKLLTMASGEQTVKIYHIDKQTGEMIDLSGIFKKGSDYITVITENIKEQMKEQMAADEMITYWLDTDMPENDFQSISKDTTFYINEDGKLVIVFDEYEVAPGSMGSVEFVIPTEAIQDIAEDGFVS